MIIYIIEEVNNVTNPCENNWRSYCDVSKNASCRKITGVKFYYDKGKTDQ